MPGASRMPKRLVSVGDLVFDFMLQVRLPVVADAHQMSPVLQLEPGGAGTTLLAARNLGMEAAAIGAIGVDVQGQLLKSMLDEAGVDTTALVILPESTTTTVISLSDRDKAGHVFLGVHGRSRDIDLIPAAREKLAEADAVFMAGYSLLEQRMAGLNSSVLSYMERSETPLYIDVGPFLGQLDGAQVDRLLSIADVAMMTDEEIQFVADGESDIDACRRLLERYSHLQIVIKLGAAGCHLLARELDLPCPGFAVDLVDTIGAGDAFDAAFIWAQLHGYSPAECGTIANAMGAAQISRAGAGRNAPTEADVQSILNANETGIQLSC